MKKIFLMCLGLAIVAGKLMAQNEEASFKNVSSMQEALDAAKRENKLLFIDCYFTGCHPCAQMDKEVYPNATVKPAMEKDFVSVKVDVFKEKWGDTIVMRYALHGFPTLLVLNADGKLIAHESGFKDAGQFLQMLAESKAKNIEKKYMNGFNSSFIDSYPGCYKMRFVEKKPIDAMAANKFIHEQKDWFEEKTALMILICPKLDKDVEDFLVKNYKTYVEKFGQELVHDRIDPIMSKRMKDVIGTQPNEQAFQQFLQANQIYFPEHSWRNILQILGDNYYLGVAKDTTAYLQFMAKHPVIYRYYYSACFSNLVAKNQSTPERCKLMAEWAAQVINIETSLELIRTAAYIEKKAGNEAGYKKYIQMCIDKTKKYQMLNKDDYEKLLTLN
jgi:thioredoxin-related protein